MINSLIVAVVATVVATVLGTLIGLALTRYQFRGRGPLNLLIYIPMATPEVILGASLLSLWVSAGVQRGLTTIIIAHVMFNISFVVVTVRARIAGFNRSLEEAAMDLGADECDDLPQGHPAADLPGHPRRGAARVRAVDRRLRRSRSFVAGQTTTFPLWVFGASRFGVPPEVNVLGTLIFAVAFVFIVLQILWARRRRGVEQSLASRSADDDRHDDTDTDASSETWLALPRRRRARSGRATPTWSSSAAADRGSRRSTASATSTTPRASA